MGLEAPSPKPQRQRAADVVSRLRSELQLKAERNAEPADLSLARDARAVPAKAPQPREQVDSRNSTPREHIHNIGRPMSAASSASSVRSRKDPGVTPTMPPLP